MGGRNSNIFEKRNTGAACQVILQSLVPWVKTRRRYFVSLIGFKAALSHPDERSVNSIRYLTHFVREAAHYKWVLIRGVTDGSQSMLTVVTPWPFSLLKTKFAGNRDQVLVWV